MSTRNDAGTTLSKQQKVSPKRPQSEVRKVPFVTRIEGAESVAITGEFTGWSQAGVPLRRGAGNQWGADLDLRPGEHQYRLIVNGQWCDDPQARARVANPHGTLNCVLKVE
jgi:hypothetical protein